jgi:hypothetical protein
VLVVDAGEQALQVRPGEPPVERVAVALNRGSNSVIRRVSASRSVKSAGAMTLRCRMENTISVWFNHDACTGRCTGVAVGYAAAMR